MQKTRRRLMYSLLIVLVWLGLVVDGSHALFGDSASLTGNTITSGSVDLQISNSQNGSSTLFADSRPGFAFSVAPGTADEKYLFLKNTSPTDIPLDIDMYVSSINTPLNNLTSGITITLTPVDAVGEVMGTAVGATLNTLIARHIPLSVTIAPGVAQRFKIGAQLDVGYGEQGQTIGYDLVFTGTQHISS